jgi:prepilin-type N-terminal cleavage/methylation domain-containing protein
MKKTQKGFTIIELIVVIAIIALLSGIVATNITKYINKAKLARVNTEVKNIEKALLSFYSKYGQYPSNDGWLCEWGPWCSINSGGDDPTDGNSHFLSEFYKFDWTNQYTTHYFIPNTFYSVNLEDTDDDGKINCGYVTIMDDSWFFMYGQKGIICDNTDCWQCLPENQYPFQTTSWW